MKTRALILSLLLFALLIAGATAASGQQVVTLPSQSPLVTFRIVFLTGAASDPADRPGLANMTASMLSDGGTKKLTYKQIVDAMFPMATSVSSQVDKEMTTFTAVTHVENLDKFYALFRSMLLEPGWRDDDLKRLKDDTTNFLRVSLRGNNDEELGKEVLYNIVYAGHPYGHHNAGTASSVAKMTVEDLQRFYRDHYTQANLVIGLAGGYPKDFPDRVKKDFAVLAPGKKTAGKIPAPKAVEGTHIDIVDKDTRSVAYSIGFPITVKRGQPDYPALLVMQSWLGQHRNSGGRLFQRMREIRGLNYGDYAYIEYFPRGMFQFEPDPNLARQQQIFQIWVRPVEPDTAHFALRLALYELDRLIKTGLTKDDFEASRSFLSKYVNLLMKTKSAELGYAIDSKYYGMPDYTSYIKNALAKLTVEDVNQAIRRHLRSSDLRIVVVSKNGEELKKKILSNEPSPMKYNAEKPKEILEEDKIVETWKIAVKPENVRVVRVDTVFE